MLIITIGEIKMEITTLSQILETEEYLVYVSDTLLNPQYHMINDTDVDVDIMIESQTAGDFGVSHRDFIECWRDYLDTIDLDDEVKSSIQLEIIEKEDYHIKKETIDNII